MPGRWEGCSPQPACTRTWPEGMGAIGTCATWRWHLAEGATLPDRGLWARSRASPGASRIWGSDPDPAPGWDFQLSPAQEAGLEPAAMPALRGCAGTPFTLRAHGRAWDPRPTCLARRRGPALGRSQVSAPGMEQERSWPRSAARTGIEKLLEGFH